MKRLNMSYLDMEAMLSRPKTNMLLIVGFLFSRHSIQLSHLTLAMITLLIVPIYAFDLRHGADQ